MIVVKRLLQNSIVESSTRIVLWRLENNYIRSMEINGRKQRAQDHRAVTNFEISGVGMEINVEDESGGEGDEDSTTSEEIIVIMAHQTTRIEMHRVFSALYIS